MWEKEIEDDSSWKSTKTFASRAIYRDVKNSILSYGTCISTECYSTTFLKMYLLKNSFKEKLGFLYSAQIKECGVTDENISPKKVTFNI